jgi:hypothetical protein
MQNMNKNQASYLFIAVLTYLVVIALVFFAATDSKNTIGFLAIAVFFALTGVFWVRRFAKGRRTL